MKKKGERCTLHFSAEPSNVDLLTRTVRSASQLSINGAIADWCDGLTRQIPGQSIPRMEKFVAKVNEQFCQKLKPEEVNYVGTNTWDECSSSEGSIAYSSRKIGKVFK